MKIMKTFKKLQLSTLLIISVLSYTSWKKSLVIASPQDKCIGKHQLPYDSSNYNNIRRQNYRPIIFNNFDKRPIETILENDNHNVVIRMKFKKELPNISGGPLEGLGSFHFDRIYFHWFERVSSAADIGQNMSFADISQNMSFPAEIHVVFFNNKYENVAQAVTHKNGIAVMAFEIKIEDVPNNKYDELENNLKFIMKPYSRTPVANKALKKWLIANAGKYFSYRGSMLIQTCDIDVIWIDFSEPIIFPPDIVGEFQRLHADDQEALIKKVDHVHAPDGLINEYRDSDDTTENGPCVPIWESNVTSEGGPCGSIPLIYTHDDEYNISNEGNSHESNEMKVGVFVIIVYLCWCLY